VVGKPEIRGGRSEAATFPHAVVEMALGHQVGNAVERAYRRRTS
jgi:hypothetical protein